MNTRADSRRAGRARAISLTSRGLALAIPIVMSVMACVIVSSVVPPPSSVVLLVGWWVLLTAIAAVVAIGVDRLGRRLMPLAWLAEVSTLFPDHTPPRFAAAMGSGSVTKLNERLDRARRSGEATPEQEGAEKLLQLIVALNTHDRRTRDHCERTRAYAELIAEELSLPETERVQLRWAALLHDVGKIAVDPALLNATEPLRTGDMEKMRRHAAEGARLVAPLEPWLGAAVRSVGEHHEQWNGRGYPNGLAGEDISLAARIVAVADAFDMLTRPTYRRPTASVAEARAELTRAAGTQFDPAIVRAFLNVSLGRLRFVMGPLSWVVNVPVLAGASTPSLVGPAASALLLGVAALPGLTAPPTVIDDPAPAPAEVEVAQPPEETPSTTVRADDLRPPDTEPPGTTAPPPPLGASDIVLRLPEDTVIEFTLGEPGDVIDVASPAAGSIATIGNRRFAYTPAANDFGTAQSSYERCVGGQCANADLTFIIDAVNDAPRFVGGPDESVPEDSGARTADGWASGISPGPADESSQAVTFTVTNDNPTLFSTQPAVSPTGVLTYTPAANTNGTATITVKAVDDGGGNDTSPPQTADITVTPKNDPPSFSAGPDDSALEDAGPQTIANWATGISPGPANESSQTVTFTVTNDNPTLFSTQPAVSLTGVLTYTPAPDANGTTTITVKAVDDGGGNDTSPPQTADITVTPKNDPPSFSAGPDDSALEDAGPQTIANWATGISPGPANESSQTVTFTVTNDNPTLFSTQPAVSLTGVLTYTPAPDANGTTTITVKAVDDGGTINGGNDTSPVQIADITITAVNDPPVAGDDPDGGDDPLDFRTVLITDLFTPAAELLDNDSDPEMDPLSLAATGPTATAEGSVQCDASGCTYTPNGTYTGLDTYDYTVTDGNGGTDNGTVTVEVVDYVPSPQQGEVVVNEVLYNGDLHGSSHRSDFIEIHNPGAAPVDIGGWTLSDNNLIVGDIDILGGFQFTFPPSTVLAGNGYAVLWMDSDHSILAPGFTNVIGGGVLEFYYGSSIPWLEEAGDEVTLFDGRFQFVDHVAWGPDTASGRNVPPPPALGVWDTLPNNEVNLQPSALGTSIALTPNGIFTTDSFCWEKNESNEATCPGALATADTDTYGTRSTSVGRDNNSAVADAGGPYGIVEGEALVLDGSASTGPPTAWNWDIDNDGQYDDASGVTPSVPWATLVGLGVDDDGVYSIALQVDGGPDASVTSLTIGNTAPVLNTTGPATVNAGNVYTLDLEAIDPGDDTITSWTINWGDGTIEAIAGNPSSVTHVYAREGFTFDILASASDEDGTWLQNELLVPSFQTDEILRFEATTGAFLQKFATADDPIKAHIGPDGRLYVSGEKSDNVLRYNAETGAFIDEFVAAGSGGLNRAEGLAFGPDGHLYVADYNGDRILRFDGTTGAFIDVFASGGLTNPYDLVFGPDSNLYVNKYTTDEVVRYDGTTGAFIDIFVAAGSGGLKTPEQMVFGPDGHLYISSFKSDEVLRYDGTTGAFIDIFVAAGGVGDLDQPTGLAFGPDGHLYVGDHLDHAILRFDGATGAFIDDYVAAGAGGLFKPSPMTFLPEQQVTTSGTRTLYFNTSGTGPDDWTFLLSALPVADPEPDHDGDLAPGLTIKQSSGATSGEAGDKYQHWSDTPGADWALNGPVTLDLWSNVKDFDGLGPARIFVYVDDCPAAGACTSLLSYSQFEDEWGEGSSGWNRRTLSLGTIDITIAAGRNLRLRLMFDNSDVWVALSGGRPSSLTVTEG